MEKKRGQYPKVPPIKDDFDHSNDVQIGALEKDGEAMMKALNEKNKMVAIVSGLEIMFVFIFRNRYQCFIHKFGAEEGRHKEWEINERNTAMLKNLDSTADQIFEVVSKPDMDYMGVMVSAEQGILNFMDYIGALPVEDTDFMDWTSHVE